ncbi:hypothetical protein MUP77_07775, partial [Candidatus Bathyarchaeota archaeon]|nr:hypothetical protein [Candidatus Bathyarchaeota archaeon]
REQVRKTHRNYYQKHKEQEKERNRKWAREHPECIKEWKMNHPEQVKETQRNGQKMFNQRHPEILKAHNFARQFPLGPCCWFCGSTENLERAHFDYKYPEQFMTLCRKHHRWIDRGCD